MSGIPAGSIVHMGGRTVINRLQDAGLQDPRVPTQTVYETGNDLVVGKVLTEADFRFQLTSWDVSCDLMALFTGEHASLGDQISGSDSDGTVYKWEDVGFINVTSPWKDNVGTDGGDVSSGVIVPNLYPTQLAYRLGVTDMAQMQATLSTGAYFMDGNNFPLEEFAAGDGVTTAFVTSEAANVYRIGGSGSANYQHVFGVMVNHVPQIPGIDYVESGGLDPGATEGDEVQVLTVTGTPTGGSLDLIYPTKPPITLPFDCTSGELQTLLDGIFGAGNTLVTGGALPGTGLTITFQGALADTAVPLPIIDDADLAGGSTPHGHISASFIGAGVATPITITFAVAPPNDAIVQFCYFTTTPHAIPQSDNLAASATLPAAVRGRDITLLLGDPGGSPVPFYGIQTFELTATCTGQLQRQMGTQDPIGYARTGIDTNGTVSVEPKDKAHLFSALALALGVNESEVLGYINQSTIPLTAVIHEPGTQNIIKSIFVPDALFQAPGENVRVQTVTQFPIRWESFTGTFHEVKGELPS